MQISHAHSSFIYLIFYLLPVYLFIDLLPVYLLIYLLPVYLLPVTYLLIYLLIYLHLMAYGHTPHVAGILSE